MNWQSVISVGGARYSVPHQLIDQRVWARIDGEELIVIHVRPDRGPCGGRPSPAHDAGAPGDQR